MSRELTLADISDLRAYEREREALRARIIELKRARRVPVGPVVTAVFENRETIRFQVQEMVRAERMLTDEAVQAELDTYNPLIPGPGQLSATLFVELTTKAELEEWLPKLVGVERAVELRVGGGSETTVLHCRVDRDHAAQLTREEVTASVHYVGFDVPDEVVEGWLERPVELALGHPAYPHATRLSPATKESLLADLRP
jgi:hypothetical protein